MVLTAWRCRIIAGLLIVSVAFARVVYLAAFCPLDLAPDEAHYWDWSRQLDWSYYSKGPLIAWLIRLSCELLGALSVHLTGSEVLSVRFPAVVCGSLLVAGLYVLTVQTTRREALALAVVAIALTMPMMAAGSSLMTIDAPYTCLWCWALVAGHRAIFPTSEQPKRSSLGPWIALGLLVGTGILAKYTMVLFLPFFGLFLWTTPGYRGQLWRPGFWLMSGIVVICCLPIVLWNWRHDWVTVRHTGGHAGLGNAFHWFGPLRYLATQFAVLLGFWFVVWARSAWGHRPGRETCPKLLYLWWLSVPMFIFFGIFSLKNGGGEANWPVAAYISGVVLAAVWLADELQSPDLARRRWIMSWTAGFVVAGLALSILIHRMSLVQPVLARIAGPATPRNPTPVRRFDPTARLRGRQFLARHIDSLRQRLRSRGIDPLLAAVTWIEPGALAFYCDGHPRVYCFGSALGERHSQYDLWRPNPLADPEVFRGQTFLIVGGRTKQLQEAFDCLEELEEVVFRDHGEPLNRWDISIGHGFRGFGPMPAKGRY
ncbi:MAG: glycosyltransferase family 39 protein [Gemmataceae bacterium]|nr:glycosyltransferase family 39 protein [Gemmataceae bacterium]